MAFPQVDTFKWKELKSKSRKGEAVWSFLENDPGLVCPGALSPGR